jgi:hypothetical protein
MDPYYAIVVVIISEYTLKNVKKYISNLKWSKLFVKD